MKPTPTHTHWPLPFPPDSVLALWCLLLSTDFLFKMPLQVSLLHCLNSLFLPLLSPNSLLSLLHWLQSTVGYRPRICTSGPHFSNVVVQPWERGFAVLCVRCWKQRGFLHSPLMLYFSQTCWTECRLWSSHITFFPPPNFMCQESEQAGLKTSKEDTTKNGIFRSDANSESGYKHIPHFPVNIFSSIFKSETVFFFCLLTLMLWEANCTGWLTDGRVSEST